MDDLFTRGKCEDFGFQDDDLMETSWSSSPDCIFDPIFSIDNDFLNNFDNEKELDPLESLAEHIKMEAEEYELSSPCYDSIIENVKDETNTSNSNDISGLNHISSNSSDSGLSSDNLDIEMSPYEPLSPAASSPYPLVHESIEYSPNAQYTNQINEEPIIVEEKPKSVKVSQIITLSPENVKPKLNIAKGKEVKIVKLSPPGFSSSSNKKVMIQVKNSNNGHKVPTNSGAFIINNNKITEVKKIVRLPGTNTNLRSVLLPVSIQDVKDMKGFKIINASAFKGDSIKINGISNQTHKVIRTDNIANMKDKLSDDCASDHTSDGECYVLEGEGSNCSRSTNLSQKQERETVYPRLILTPEEKRLLAKEGIVLPTHYPLTKHEERELKRIRRKIRNKISAQDSRKRKKEYVDGLEERVKQCTEENQSLMKRIKLLQAQNQNLMSQMKKLQSLLSKGTNKTAQPATCLMVLLLSLALIAAPNLKLGQNIKETELEEAMEETILQNRRNLLFDVKDKSIDIFDEEINMSDIFSTNENSEKITVQFGDNDPFCKKSKFLVDFDVDDQNWYQPKEEKLQKRNSAFDSLASIFQENRKAEQTSGFNIRNDQDYSNNFLDKDVLDLLTQKSNGIYELNIDKVMGSSIDTTSFGVDTNHVYTFEADRKLNYSELKTVKKY